MQTQLDFYTTTSTQEQRILEALRRGDRLTAMDMLVRFGSMQAATRIFYLKREGWPIQKKMITTPNGKRVAQYWLERGALRSKI